MEGLEPPFTAPITDSCLEDSLGYTHRYIMNCLNCGIGTTNPKFCSRRCSAIWTNKTYPKRTTNKKCIICGDKVKSYRHNRCELHWNEYKENKHLDITLIEHTSRYPHLHKSSTFASVRSYARSLYKDLLKQPCAKCGYSKHVELAHIKAISDFPMSATMREVNAKDNVIQLCPNCHWEMDHNL